MERKVYVCRIVKDDKMLVCDIVAAEYAEAALQASERKHRVKLAKAGAETSFGEPQELTDELASFRNGATTFRAEPLADVLQKLSGESVDFDNAAALRAELGALSQAMTHFTRSLKKA